MHSEGIWNDLELQRKNENNVSKVCVLKVFETSWNCREKLRTMSLKNAFWHFLKRFGTVEFILKTMSLKHAFLRYLKRFGNAEKKWEQCI